MTTAHTPGPYHVCDVGDYTDYNGRCSVILSCDFSKNTDKRIAVVLGKNLESKATAKLLGAVPELLEATIKALCSISHAIERHPKSADLYLGVLEELHAVIAKATGVTA